MGIINRIKRLLGVAKKGTSVSLVFNLTGRQVHAACDICGSYGYAREYALRRRKKSASRKCVYLCPRCAK